MTGDHDTPPGQYNVYPIVQGSGLGELFTAEVTDNGVYLDHNFMEGCLFLSHEDFEKLDSFRQEFLEEINEGQ